MHTTKSPGLVVFTITVSPSWFRISVDTDSTGDMFWAISVQRLEQYIIPLWLLGLALFTISRLKAKGVPVSTADLRISLTTSFNRTVRLEMRRSFTQFQYRSSHSFP